MCSSAQPTLVAFLGETRVARGSTRDVALALHGRPADGQMLVLDESTGDHVDLDLSGSRADVEARYGSDGEPTTSPPTPRRRGRPKLGVVGREVTLLPRHWAWLDTQRGGASAALRRLVDQARKSDDGHRVRQAQDRTLRLMTALAGNRDGFEEACRALYAADRERFRANVRGWPAGVRSVVEDAAAEAFGPVGPSGRRSP